jgi:hypothetical protein
LNGICRVYDLMQRQLLEIDALRQPIAAAAAGRRGEITAVSARGDAIRLLVHRRSTAPAHC